MSVRKLTYDSLSEYTAYLGEYFVLAVCLVILNNRLHLYIQAFFSLGWITLTIMFKRNPTVTVLLSPHAYCSDPDHDYVIPMQIFVLLSHSAMEFMILFAL